MGFFFKIHRRLGNSYQEKYYQRTIELELKSNHIQYAKEFLVRLDYNGAQIGKYFLDFVIENKIAIEVKTIPFIKDEYYKQLLAYLDCAKLKLGIIVNFRTNRLTYKRLVNPRVKI